MKASETRSSASPGRDQLAGQAAGGVDVALEELAVGVDVPAADRRDQLGVPGAQASGARATRVLAASGSNATTNWRRSASCEGVTPSQRRTDPGTGRADHVGALHRPAPPASAGRPVPGSDVATGRREGARRRVAACVAATRRADAPRTSSRSSRSTRSRSTRPLAPDYNVAPTKEVYAVVERPPSPRDAEEPEPPERQLRVLTWGLVPSWAKDPSIGNRMINARMETVAEKPAYRRAFASRRCLLPADGYFEWYPTEQQTEGRQAAASSRSSSSPRDGGVLAMAGLYEIWRDPTRADDDPDRFRWTCTVLTTDGRGRRRPHPRPDAADGRARPLRRLARPDAAATATTCSTLLVPAAPGRLEAYPVSHRRSTTCATTARSWSSRSRPTSALGVSAADDRPTQPVADAARRRPAGHRPRPRDPVATLLLEPRRRRRHRRPRPGGAGRARCPRHGHHRRPCSSSRGGSPARRSRRAPPMLDAALRRRRRRSCALRTPLVVGGRRAGARSAARMRPRARRRRLPGARVPAAPARAAGEVPARRAARAPACRRWWSRASATRSGTARGVPRAASTLAVVPGARPRRSRCRRPRPLDPGRGARRSSSRRRWSGSCARSPGIPTLSASRCDRRAGA